MSTPISAELFSTSSDLWWEIDDEDWYRAIQNSSHITPPGVSRQAALNRLLLDLWVPWLAEELEADVRLWPRTETADSIWSVVNGTALDSDIFRLVGIATESIETQFRIPQEWIDIPEWIADYYLLFQVDLEGSIVRLRGFSTHQRLKERGQYDPFDRTYVLPGEELLEDINALFLTRDFGLDFATRSEIAALPQIETTQANSLLAQLGNSEIDFPRLERPFQVWGACLANDRWRESLYERRQAIATRSFRQLTNLADWFADIPEVLANGWRTSSAGAASTNFAFRAPGSVGEAIAKKKVIRVAEYEFILAVNLEPQEDGRTFIRASVKPFEEHAHLPEGLTFDLLDRSGAIVQAGNPTSERDYLSEQNACIGFAVVFCFRVTVGDALHEEWFIAP